MRLWSSVLISAFFLWLALRGQDLTQTARSLADAHYGYVLPALALYFTGVWVRALRWRVLLSPMGRFPVSSLFPVVVIGYMANDVLPARMGEVVRVYVFRSASGSRKRPHWARSLLNDCSTQRRCFCCWRRGQCLFPSTAR